MPITSSWVATGQPLGRDRARQATEQMVKRLFAAPIRSGSWGFIRSNPPIIARTIRISL